MDAERESETAVPFWNHTRLSEQLKEVVEQVKNRSRQQAGTPTHPTGSTDIASVLAIFGGLLLVLTLWAFIKHFLATSQSVCNCRKPEDLATGSQAAPPCTIGHDASSASSVVGMARVVARVQAGLVKPAELPPPYEAPPSYKAAVAMSLDETPPPDYLLREAVIV